MTGFVYSGSSGAGPTSAFTYAAGLPLGECGNCLGQQLEKQSVQVRVVQPASSFLSLASGDAIVDIGATQDLIGRVAFEAMKYQLSLVGLQPIMVDVPVAVPLGIGGAAKVKGVALVPVSPGGVPGVLEFTILESEVPPLLSVGFLEFLGAEISLVSNLIRFTKIEVELLMNRLSTGHRTISLIHWRPEDGSFPVPDELKSKFGLKKGAFNLDCNAPSEYMKGSSGLTSSPSTLWMSADSGREVASNQTSEFSKTHEPNDSEGVAVEHVSENHMSCRSSISSSSSFTSSSPGSSEKSTDVKLCVHQFEESRHLRSTNGVATSGSEQSAEYLMGATNTRTVQKFDQSLPLSHGIHQHAHEGKVAGTAVQGLSHLGDLTPHVPPPDPGRGQESQQSAGVCGGHKLDTGFVSASQFQEDEARQPVRELDSLWGMRQPAILHAEGQSTQEQGKGKAQGIPIDSTHHYISGSGGGGYAGDDGAIMHYKDKLARATHFEGSLKCRSPSVHRGDEDALHLHAEHDDRHGPTECPAHSDDGKSGLLYRVNGQQSVADATDDVQREFCRRESAPQFGAASAAGSTDRRSNGRRHGLSLEHDGESQCTRSNRPLRWPAKLVTAAAVWNAVIPLSQTTAPVQAFLGNQGLGSDVWLIQDADIPSRRGPELCHQDRASRCSELPAPGRASGTQEVCHQGRVSGTSDLCPQDRVLSNSELCGQGRALSTSELCHQGRAPSTADLCHQDRACNYVHGGRSLSCLPDPWGHEVKIIGRSQLGGIWVREGTIQTSAVFAQEGELLDALDTLPQGSLSWIRLESEESGQRFEDRPYGVLRHRWNGDDGPVRCTLWLLSDKLLWLAGWADNLDCILRVDEGLGLDQKCWAIQSTALTESLREDVGREIPVKGHGSDLKRCGNSLTVLAMHEKKTPNQIDFAELFSPPRVSPEARALGLRVSNQVFDLEAGWDVRKVDHRKDFRSFQKESRPRFLTLSPECKAYSQLMNINWERMDPQKRAEIEREGALMWNFSLESAENQVDVGDYFALEHPAGAKSWKLKRTQALLRRPEVAVIEFDQCALGLTVVPSGELSRKRTKIATNHAGLAMQLASLQCSGDHTHVPLENNLAGKARIYPLALCQLLAQSAKEAVLGLTIPSFPTSQSWNLATDWPEDEEDEPATQAAPCIEEVTDADILEKDQPQPKVTESQKRMVLKVHVNTGHPPQEQFLRMMRAGGAHTHVLKYIKEEFQCEQCAIKNRPDNRRRAHCPRSFAFNRVVSIDVLYIKFQQKSIPILNMVCTGSNYQVAQRLPVPEGQLRTWPGDISCRLGLDSSGHRLCSSVTQAMSSKVVLSEDVNHKASCSTWPFPSVPGRTARQRGTAAGWRRNWIRRWTPVHALSLPCWNLMNSSPTSLRPRTGGSPGVDTLLRLWSLERLLAFQVSCCLMISQDYVVMKMPTQTHMGLMMPQPSSSEGMRFGRELVRQQWSRPRRKPSHEPWGQLLIRVGVGLLDSGSMFSGEVVHHKSFILVTVG